MKITILTLFPEMFDGFKTTSIIKRAINKNVVDIDVIDIRSFSSNKHKTVDDTPYGGGHGMVMTCQPLVDALKSVKQENTKSYIMAPYGTKLKQEVIKELAKIEHIVLICGHYEGIDARVENYVDGALSIGDYILTGGELASMVISDAVIRLLDGAIVEASHQEESFENNLLEYPQYTKPDNFEGYQVPEVLLSGHHKNIEKYRLKESLRRTLIHRPDLLQNYLYTEEEKILLKEINEENI